MKKSGFGASASHTREHRELQGRFESVVKAFNEEDPAPGIAMAATLEAWLESHVRRTDRVLARHLRARGMHERPTSRPVEPAPNEGADSAGSKIVELVR
jgi:hemerythrin